mmetsp:Transcript_7202/g.17277  ORF Transcript_7202/g.17277 Transcript_7202/m.17277 type:complete len:178 (+) Transcript_7202:239-772(+)
MSASAALTGLNNPKQAQTAGLTDEVELGSGDAGRRTRTGGIAPHVQAPATCEDAVGGGHRAAWPASDAAPTSSRASSPAALGDPPRDLLGVGLHFLHGVAREYFHDLSPVAISCFFLDYHHNFTLHVFFQLLLRVASLCQPIVQNRSLRCQHHYEGKPPFGKKITGVVINNTATFNH